MESTRKNKFIYGIRPVLEAISSGIDIDKVMIQQGLKNELFGKLRSELQSTSIPYQFVPAGKLNSITGKNHQGVIALVSLITYQKIEEIVPLVIEKGQTPLILVLDRITDVRNFGAIARSAECSGVDAIVIPEKETAQINADSVKTSAGALTRIPVCRTTDIAGCILYLKNSGLRIISATEKGDKFYFRIKMTDPVAIIMGSEENGISGNLLKLSDDIVKIPVRGSVESLNVSVAAGIILYEAVRQRTC